MSPVLHRCAVRGCGRLFSKTRRRQYRCPEHDAEYVSRDNARRATKQFRQGRNTARWRRLRQAALERDGHRCQDCGTSEDLTIHLAPELEGVHAAATLDDLLTLCRRCHGVLDGARSRTGGVKIGALTHFPAPSGPRESDATPE